MSIYTAQRRCSEKDVDEVLQTHFVYTNVSKGVLATSKDLLKAFETGTAPHWILSALVVGSSVPVSAYQCPCADYQYPFPVTSAPQIARTRTHTTSALATPEHLLDAFDTGVAHRGWARMDYARYLPARPCAYMSAEDWRRTLEDHATVCLPTAGIRVPTREKGYGHCD